MNLNAAVFDLWVFRRVDREAEFLLLHTSEEKAERHFNGGRFWQIPSGVFQADERVPNAADRELAQYGLVVKGVWSAEHAYTIYNPRFHEVEIITVYAVEVDQESVHVRLNPAEHSDFAWHGYTAALDRVFYRGLKDGLRSVHEYITGVPTPAPELRLR
jgi:predicted NUDIX family NTP pyrophosphohydrolase